MIKSKQSWIKLVFESFSYCQIDFCLRKNIRFWLNWWCKQGFFRHQTYYVICTFIAKYSALNLYDWKKRRKNAFYIPELRCINRILRLIQNLLQCNVNRGTQIGWCCLLVDIIKGWSATLHSFNNLTIFLVTKYLYNIFFVSFKDQSLIKLWWAAWLITDPQLSISITLSYYLKVDTD